MSLNFAGTPNPQFYVLGRGRILLAANNTSTGLPSAYRHLGNSPAFAATVTVEEFTHKSSLSGFSEVDARAVTSREIGLSFSLDEISHDNLALFFNGLADTVTNPAVAGVGTAMAPVAITTSATEGMWYQLLTSYAGLGTPISLDPLAVTPTYKLVVVNTTTTMNLVLGTDYEVDPENGMIFIKFGATGVTNGDDLSFYVAASAGAPATIHRMQALTATNQEYSLKFISVNPLNSDEEITYDFHRVSISANGDLNLINESEASVAQFTGAALKNAYVGSAGATLTVYGLP